MPDRTHHLLLVLTLLTLFAAISGCILTPSSDDQSRSAFYIAEKTKLIDPADLQSEEAISTYGAPILLPDTGGYTIQTFGDLFTERPQTYPISFTVYGDPYTVILTRANWDMIDDGIDSYSGQLDPSDYQTGIVLTIAQNNEIRGSFAYKNHRIHIEPLHLSANGGLPLHIIYQDTYPKLPPIPATNNSAAIFTVVGHTTLIAPEIVNSTAFSDTYGPVHIPSPITKYDIVFFHDPIPPLGSETLEIPITIHGNPYTITMQRTEPEDAGASTPIHSYLGQLSGAGSKIYLTEYPGGNMDIGGRLNTDSTTAFGLSFRNGTLISGSVAAPGETIVITPLQTSEYLSTTTNPPYLVYSSLDILPAEPYYLTKIPSGELRLVQVFPIDFVGEHPIPLTDEIFSEHPALRSMIWGIHPPMKAGIEGISSGDYTVMVTQDEADTLIAKFGSEQFLTWNRGTYYLMNG
ncbi:hypothetical protein [Methanorbis furvi]|uniref:Uncharacterized protein n=1 Tax=Methanorbis furvi TaxID=3028299 RepID=A0AAE4MC35_9EURY|nr:hypothetical protein [Methanocorpusculaceae archaeon Ag1]